MSFLCKLGGHDWEYLYKDLAENAWLDHTKSRVRIRSSGTLGSVHKRVCLSCEKYEDTYTLYISRREQEENEINKRQELAQRIMDYKNEN